MIAVFNAAGFALHPPDRSPHLIQNDVGQCGAAPRTEGIDIFPNERHVSTPFGDEWGFFTTMAPFWEPLCDRVFLP
jgi:hypothetical protein